jgi:hypothetical protein
MKIIEDADIWETEHPSRRRAVYDEIAYAPIGTTFLLTAGDDYPADEHPNKFRQRIMSAMRVRGVSIETRTKDGDIYIRVIKHYAGNRNGHG